MGEILAYKFAAAATQVAVSVYFVLYKQKNILKSNKKYIKIFVNVAKFKIGKSYVRSYTFSVY